MSVCVCGHEVDEHNGSGECQVEDCDCWLLEIDEAEFLS